MVRAARDPDTTSSRTNSPPRTPPDARLLISPNLALAVEYEERTRALLRPLAEGLPPPPRRKSRPRTGRSEHDSPQSSRDSLLGSLPGSPVYALTPGAHASQNQNPYINPTPRLSYLMRTEVDVTVRPARDTRDTFGQPEGREGHRAAASVDTSPTELQKALSRHHRYLSSLQKVERLLSMGKGKGAAAGGSGSAGSSPRTSDVSGSPQERPSKEALLRRMLEKGNGSARSVSASAPSSPTRALTNDIRAVHSNNMSGEHSLQAASATGRSLAQSRYSHGRKSSDMSSSNLSPASDSTHSSAYPSATSERHRISISSTIYPSTNSHSHSFDNAHYRSFGRSSMATDRESFIDMNSPTSPPFSAGFSPFDTSPDPLVAPEASPSNDFNSTEASMPSSKPRLPRLTTNTTAIKPPLPTTPKPSFRRSRSAQPPHERASPSSESKPTYSPLHSSGAEIDSGGDGLPPTTNLLKPWERADRVRKTRKLTQLFGQTPGVPGGVQQSPDVDVVNGCMPMPGSLNLNLTMKRKQHRPALSMIEDGVAPGAKPTLWPPPEGPYHVSIGDRRFSSPTTSSHSFAMSRSSLDSGSVRDFGKVIEVGTEEGRPSGEYGRLSGEPGEKEARSPTSFMDLSDEDGHDGPDDIVQTPRPARRSAHAFPHSPSSTSLADSFSSEQHAEEERRRKREKLAKLHRFLGSRVPAHLVLGSQDDDQLPPLAPTPQSRDTMTDELEIRRPRALRRRSSSAAEFSHSWSDDIDRLKDELNEREKAINVRRAVKMEKMFGVAPPQTLYHTRTNNSQSSASGQESSPAYKQSPLSPTSRNINQAPYKGKSKKKDNRPGTSDSSKPLVASPIDEHPADTKYHSSKVYLHYQHSLNSLNDIIDRDDRESLAELHDFISIYRVDQTFAHVESPPAEEEPAAVSPSLKLERRRSLPSRTSMASISSEFSLASFAIPPLVSPAEEGSSFQARRRRAAKLTNFFGVNYRELMSDVLESIEKGLEEESGRGTLKPDELQDLVQKLRNIKTKRNSLS